MSARIEETMAGWMPVGTSNRCSLSVMTRHGVSGHLIGQEEPVGNANALRSILTDPQVGALLGAFDHGIADDPLHAAIVVTKTGDFYLELVSYLP